MRQRLFMPQTPIQNSDLLFRLTRMGLYALLLIPFLYWSKLLFLHSSPKTYALFAVTQTVFVLSLWGLSRRPHESYRPSPTGKLLIVYLIILVLTSLVGEDPQYSFWGSLDRMGGILTWLHLTVIFFLTVTILNSPRTWVRFFSFSTLVALAIAFVHLLALWGISLIPEAHGGSTFGNSTFFAVYLLFHFFFALYVCEKQSKKEWRIFWFSCAAFLFLVLYNVSAIAVQYSVVGGIILLVALLLILTTTPWKRILGWFTLAALLISFFTTSILIFRPDSPVRQAFVERSSESRFVLWDMAWSGILERPVMGWGLENFSIVALEHYNTCLGSQTCGYEMWFDRAHNKLLDVWIESGALGLILYLSLFGASIYELNQARKKRQITPITFAIFASALATYFIQNLTGLDTNTSLFFWILLLAFSSVAQAGDREKPSPIPQLIPLSASILLPISLFFFVVQPLRGNLAFGQTFNASTLQERIEAYERTTTLSPLGRDMRRTWLSAQTEGVFWSISTERLKSIESAARIELGLAQAGLEDSLAHTNQELRVHIALGIMYQTEAHFFDPTAFDDAETILLQAIERFPAIPQPKWTLAGVYLDRGRTDEALALTQSVLDASPSSPQAYNYQLIVLKWKGDDAAFAELAQQALEVIPALRSDIDELRSTDFSTRSQEILRLFHR